jgi:hypothetical protein
MKEYFVGIGFKKQGEHNAEIVYTANMICTQEGHKYDIPDFDSLVSSGRNIAEYNDDYTYKKMIAVKPGDIMVSSVLAVREDQHVNWKKLRKKKKVNNFTLHPTAGGTTTNLYLNKLTLDNSSKIGTLQIVHGYRITKLSSKYPYTPSSEKVDIDLGNLSNTAIGYLLFEKFIGI